MNFIQQIRAKAGLSQQQLARSAGTSQPAIAAYEAGRKSPTLKTLQRISYAAGLEPHLVFVAPMSREDKRSLAFHRAITDSLKKDPTSVINRARRNLDKLRELHPDASTLLEEWQRWLDLPVDTITYKIECPDTHAREMRQVSPFSGILSNRERVAVLKKFRDESYP